MAEILLLAGAIAAGCLSLWLLRSRRTQRLQLAESRRLLQRSRMQYAEMKLALAQLERLDRWQKSTRAGIEGGTAAVRAIHKGIASIPFGILEQIPSTSLTTQQVRRIHDLSSDAVYASISQASRWLGERLQDELQRGQRQALKDAGDDRGASLPDDQK